MDWKHYNVHWEAPSGLKGKNTVTALSKEDAKTTAENLMRIDNNNGFPFEGKVIKVIGPLGVHQRTQKQQLAQHYRSCIGAAMMVDKAIKQQINSPLNIEKVLIAQSLAMSQSAKLQRDIRDLFRKAGLNIK